MACDFRDGGRSFEDTLVLWGEFSATDGDMMAFVLPLRLVGDFLCRVRAEI